MPPLLLFALTVAIWGSTWYAITFQLGTVAIEWSVAWRFLLAALTLLAWCALSGRRLRFGARDHAVFAGLGALLFSFNYVLVYLGTGYLASGLVAVVFSMMSVANQINGAVFLGQRVEARVMLGALLGLGGLVLVFLPEFDAFRLSDGTLKGIVFCLAATVIASLGNTLAATERARGLPLFAFNGYAMLYGALLTAFAALAMGKAPGFDPRPAYVLSLVYLAMIGSVAAFSMYMTLLKTLGIGRAGYISVLIPVVALAISTLLEGYRWTPAALAGVVLVLLGNLLLRRRRVAPA